MRPCWTCLPNPYSDNPYASPTFGYDESFTTSTAKAFGQHNLIQFEDVFGFAWNLYQRQMGIVLGAVLIVGVINFGSSYALQFGSEVIGAESPDAALFILVIGQIVLALFNTFLHIGQTKILLDVARGRPGDLSDLLSGGRWFGWVILGWIAYVIMLYMGILLLLIPAIFVALFFGQFMYLMIDRDMNFGDAFSTSMTMSNGNKATLFLIYLVGTLIIIGATLLCLLPVIFFGPFVALLYVSAYVKMAGPPMGKL